MHEKALAQIEDTLERSVSSPPVNLSALTPAFFGMTQSSAGVHVDRLSVLAYPAVFRCLTLISGKIAKLPLDVYKESKQGREIDYEHDAHWLLSRQPSPLYTPHTFKKVLVANALLHGNAYAWILRDEFARPTELILLNPECTGVAYENGGLVYFTRISSDNDIGAYRKILPENILHIKGLSHDGLTGHSVIHVLSEAFGIGLAAQKYGAKYFANNTAPGMFVIQFPQGMSPDQQREFRKDWDKIHLGIEQAHKFGVLTHGATIEQFKIDNDTAQFLETREFEVACGIANIFGVPANKLNININTSYNSLDQTEKAFLNDTLDDWLTCIEEECEAKLLRYSQQVRDSHDICFDRRSLEQADTKLHTETVIAKLNGGLMTENEARSEMDLPSVSGADGDRLRMPSNLTFVDLVANPPTPVAPPQTEPVPPSPQPIGSADGVLPLRFQRLHDATMRRLNERLKRSLKQAMETREDMDIENHVAVFMECGLDFTDATARDYIANWTKENLL